MVFPVNMAPKKGIFHTFRQPSGKFFSPSRRMDLNLYQGKDCLAHAFWGEKTLIASSVIEQAGKSLEMESFFFT